MFEHFKYPSITHITTFRAYYKTARILERIPGVTVGEPFEDYKGHWVVPASTLLSITGTQNLLKKHFQPTFGKNWYLPFYDYRLTTYRTNMWTGERE